MHDYENISIATARPPTSPNLYDDHTSEGEVELDYSQVSFTATPQRHMTNRDSSSSDDEETSYSDIRIWPVLLFTSQRVWRVHVFS